VGARLEMRSTAAIFRSALIVTAIVALAATGCDGSDANKLGATKQTEAKVLFMANGNAGPLLGLEQFAQAVARESERRLRIEYRNEWRLGEPTAELDLLGDVADDKADLGWVASRALSSLGMPEFDALQAPLLIDSYELEERVLGSDVVRDMAGRMASLGVEPVGVLPGPLQYLLTTMPVTVPADLSGRVIGYTGYEHGARTLEALGARPRSLAAVAADYGGLDGGVAHTDPLTQSGFHRQAKHLAANLVFWPRPLVVFASPRVDSADLEILRRAATEAIPWLRAAEEERERDQAQAMCLAGVRLHEVNLVAMRRAVRPVYARLLSEPGSRRVIESIQTIARDLSAPRSVLRCDPGSRPADETLPVGTYEVTITQAEARRAGSEKDGYSGGRFRLEIQPDEFILRDVTESPAEIGIQGSYSVFRDRFVGNGTNGDKLTARWEAEGDELRFTDLTLRARGGGAETDSPYSLVWTTHPWRRVR
jgi:TRAP-type C4-dicarboxylate transport system substrate-binding protein